jgi:hypothetical protein
MFRCIKDKNKMCSYQASIRVTGETGVLECSSDALLKCCRVKDQIAAAKKILEKHNP